MDTPVTVEATWRRNGTELFGGIHDGGRITVSKPPVATSPFQATNLLEASDAGLYECTATITPQNTTFINGTKSLISRNITIAGKRHEVSAMYVTDTLQQCL